VGLEPPETVARSDAEPPIVIDAGVTAVVTVGVAFMTVRVSPAAPHTVAAALLLTSPLYEAMKK